MSLLDRMAAPFRPANAADADTAADATLEDAALQPTSTPSAATIDLSAPDMTMGFDAGREPSTSAANDLCADWATISQSADRDLIPSKDILDARTIDLTQNDGFAAGAEQHHVNHAVGTGLKLTLTPTIFDTPEDNAALGDAIETAWRDWTQDVANNVDITGRHNWSALQAQAYRSLMTHGEILAVFEARRTTSSKQSRIRIIDPARLSDPKDRRDLGSKDIRGGIEYNRDGVPVAYWISDRHPRGHVSRNPRINNKLTWDRIPATGTGGRRIVFHTYDPLRAEQSRGVALAAPIIRASKMLDKLSDATLQAAVLQSVFAVVVKSNADYEQIMQVIGAEGAGADADGLEMIQKFVASRAEYYRSNRIVVKGAKAVHLLPDEDLDLKQALSANPDTAEFLKEMRTECARGLGMSLENYTGDYSKTSFSSSRMSAIEGQRGHEGRRARTLEPFCSWVLDLFAQEHFIQHPTLLPNGTTYAQSRAQILRAKWAGPPQVEVDPAKAATAAQKRLDAGISTLADECAAQGRDWQDVLTQRAKELRMMESLDLFELEAKAQAAKAAQSEPTDPNDDPDPDDADDPEGNNSSDGQGGSENDQ